MIQDNNCLTTYKGVAMNVKAIIVMLGTAAGIVSVLAQTPPPPPAKAVAAPAQQKTAQTPDGIYISRAAIALDIDEREPKDTASEFPSEVKRLYCFTEVKNGAGHEIQHRWYYKDEMVASISLKITSNRFRTQSAKTIVPNMIGDWRVAIVDSKDESILKMLNFTIK